MTPYYQDHLVTIYHGDSRWLLADQGQVDLVLTDPPYGIGEKWSRSEMVGKNGKSRLWGRGETWDDESANQELVAECAWKGRASIIWGGNYFSLPPAGGWLVWDKVQEFSGASAELAWTDLKQPVRTFRLSRIDAYVNRAESGKVHPTEKPISLMRWCIGFVPWATTILDPFMGSGTTLRAAKDLGRKAVGIEIEERYCEVAARRMGQESLAL